MNKHKEFCKELGNTRLEYTEEDRKKQGNYEVNPKIGCFFLKINLKFTQNHIDIL